MNRSTLYAFFLLCVLIMHTMSNSLVVPGLEFKSFQSSISEHTAPDGCITSYDSPDIDAGDDYKPPKHSFLDYSTFLTPTYPSYAYNPVISSLTRHESVKTPPEVFLDIEVPPDHA